MKNSYKVNVDQRDYEVTVESDTDDDFDYIDYEKSLTNILEQAQHEFWAICVDFNRHQIIVGRNNLWVAAALIAAYAAMYNRFHTIVDFANGIGLVFSISFVLSVLAFGLCLYGMPSRKGYVFPYNEGWGDLAIDAYKRLEKKANNANIIYITDTIELIDEANKTNKNENSKRAKIFRVTSWLLVTSFCLSLLSGILFLYEKSKNDPCRSLSANTENHIRCIVMSNEESDIKTSVKPDVPVPSKPGETKNQDTGTKARMALDQADTIVSQGGNVITEDKSKNN